MGGMGQTSEQTSKPRPETILATRALLMYLGLLSGMGGRGDWQKQLQLSPAMTGGIQGGMSQGGGQGLFTGGSPFNVNPQALMPSGQPGPGNLPGTILPNYQNLLNLSGRSFWGSMDPQQLGSTFGMNQGGG